MWCSDPLLDYLKSYGYCVVRWPRSNLKPLQILSKQGREVSRLGELTEVFLAGGTISLPTVSKNIKMASISGKQTRDLKLGIGLSVLEGVLAAMGGSTSGLHAQYQQASTVAFEFHDVLEDKVDVVKLDQYLADADVNPYSPYAISLLEAEALVIITSTLKSRSFSIETREKSGTALQLSVPDIQNVVGGNVKVSGQADLTAKLTFDGHKPLVFGFQYIQVLYYEGCYRTLKPGPLGVNLRGSDSEREASDLKLEYEGPFLRLQPD